ncbi:hypothetical protein [Ferruginibacter sp.]|nr:hypothetical protein [Ferruginibacter sp.]
MKYLLLLITICFVFKSIGQTSGASSISSIEYKANQIEKNDIKVGELNRQHLETYNLESIKLKKLKKELNDLIEEKIAVLDEYRRGQFCTGCSVPRSQFGPGESFPHTGQRVRAATPQELAVKEKEYDDKIARKREELKLFEFSENEFTRKRADIDQQMNNLKNQSDKLREEIVALSKAYKEIVVKEAIAAHAGFISELMRIIAEKHFIEDRINIITVKIADINAEESKALNESAEKVRRQNEEDKQKISSQIEGNKQKLQQLLQRLTSRLDPLKLEDGNLMQQLFNINKQLQNSSKLTADEVKTLEAEKTTVEDRIAQLQKSITDYENDYTASKQQIETENRVLEDKKWNLTINLTKRQQETSELLKKAFTLRRKILEDAKIARQTNLQLTGELLLSKKAAARKKFMVYAADADNERVRLVRACQKAGCSCYGIDTHGTIVGNWNKAEGCVGEMEAAHFTTDPIYGCVEETAIYRQHYSSLINGLSDADIRALQKQSGKIRYDLILKKISN